MAEAGPGPDRCGLSQAEGAVEQTESLLDETRGAVRNTILRAPKDTIVTAHNTALGQVVGAAQVVLTIATPGGLEAVFSAASGPRLDRAFGSIVT